MPWNLDDSRPIYLQLMERIQHDIISGVYQPGDKLPSVRDLALDAEVNPNTMQRAMAELEREGLVFPQRTAGRFVTEDAGKIERACERLAREETGRYLRTMRALGRSGEDVRALVDALTGKEEDDAGV